jgi:curli biogenesis system outer membrane secretion channel CsgG
MIHYLRGILLVTINILICASPLAADEISLVPVTANGWGATKSEAVKAALSQAVAQVTGSAIKASSQVQSNTRQARENDERTVSSEKSLSKTLTEASRGVVDSYEIVSLGPHERGWEATINARVARLTPGSSSRRQLAILPFSHGRQIFSVLGQVVDSSEASRLLTQSLVDKVTSSRRFMVLDREFLDIAQQEASFVVDNPMVPMSRLLEIANTVVAEYIIVGQLEAFSVTSESRALQGFDRPFITQQATVSVTYRVIDVASNQVKYSGTDVISFGNDELPSGLRALVLTTKVLEKTAERISETMLDAIYPVLVAGVSGDRLTLNQGGDLIKQGSVYDLYRFGKEIFDPYSRESLGREEIPVGTVTISEVRSKMSVAFAQGLQEDVEAGFAPEKYVLRLKKRGDLTGQISGSAKHEETKQRIRSKKEKTDENW